MKTIKIIFIKLEYLSNQIICYITYYEQSGVCADPTSRGEISSYTESRTIFECCAVAALNIINYNDLPSALFIEWAQKYVYEDIIITPKINWVPWTVGSRHDWVKRAVIVKYNLQLPCCEPTAYNLNASIFT